MIIECILTLLPDRFSTCMATNDWHDGLFHPEDYSYEYGLPDDPGLYANDMNDCFYDGYVACCIEEAGLDYLKFQDDRYRAHKGAIAAGHAAGGRSYDNFLKSYLRNSFGERYDAYLEAAARGRRQFEDSLKKEWEMLHEKACMLTFFRNLPPDLSPYLCPPKRVCEDCLWNFLPDSLIDCSDVLITEDCQLCSLLASAAWPGSSAQTNMIRAWLQVCDDSHDCSTKYRSSAAQSPTRLIDVRFSGHDKLKLHCPTSQELPKYATLSHCWGKATSKDNRSFCTKSQNYASRTRGFTVTELPQTFRDAIKVTVELGIPYLWIDSLCIIQDNSNDWEQESGRMGSVYQHAFCTIAATSATSSYDGFLLGSSSRVSKRQVVPRRRSRDASSKDSFFAAIDREISNSPLHKRAWVFQEVILSRRLIYFGIDHVYFECGKGHHADNFMSRSNEMYHGEKHDPFDGNFPENMFGVGPWYAIMIIRYLYQQYSRLELTYNTDRCVAIAGLEAAIARSRNCKSVYGILDQFLYQSLSWRRSDGCSMRPIDYKSVQLPSWSWMAYEGSIDYMETASDNVTPAINLRLEEEPNPNISHFPTHRKHALVADVGVFLKCTLERVGPGWTICATGLDVGRIWYDTDDSNHDLLSKRCVVLARKTFPEKSYLDKFYLLVVERTQNAVEYTRVGAGWIKCGHVKREKQNVRII